MSIFVVGMHRSGTSVLTALLAMAGADPGPSGELTGANEFNPKGFWELNRFRAINEHLLHRQHRDWDCPLGFDPARLNEGSESAEARARELLRSLSSGGCFVVKDPRLCLTFGFWDRLCPNAVPVMPIRSPVEIARSLYGRNTIPIPIGIALWEYYLLSAVRATRAAGALLVDHADLIERPVETLGKLIETMQPRLDSALRMPAEADVRDFVDRDLHHHVLSDEAQRRYLVPEQAACWEAARAMSIEALEKRELSAASRAALEGYEAQGRQFSRVRRMQDEIARTRAEGSDAKG